MSCALTEEVWRAACLTGLAGLGTAHAVLVTAVAFGVAHFEPIARAISAALFGAFAAWLFFKFGSAWVPLIARLTVNIGVRYVVRLAPR